MLFLFEFELEIKSSDSVPPNDESIFDLNLDNSLIDAFNWLDNKKVDIFPILGFVRLLNFSLLSSALSGVMKALFGIFS